MLIRLYKILEQQGAAVFDKTEFWRDVWSFCQLELSLTCPAITCTPTSDTHQQQQKKMICDKS